MDRTENNYQPALDPVDSGNASAHDRNTEREDHTEIDQPNPSTATPGIPDEMPVREIR